MPELAQLMEQHLPDIDFKKILKAEQQARLAHKLQEMFNQTKMYHQGKVKEWTFNAYPKLNKAITEKWDLLYGSPKSDEKEKAKEPEKPMGPEEDPKRQKKRTARDAFGMGAKVGSLD